MKGIYLTEEGKQEIEAKIAELKSIWKMAIPISPLDRLCYDGMIEVEKRVYKEILSSAIIIPVEETWYDVINKSTKINLIYDTLYPNGVIIQPK